MTDRRFDRSAFVTLAFLAATAGPILLFPSRCMADDTSFFSAGNFSNDAIEELKIFAPKGIAAFGMAPNMGFALATKDGRIVTRNTPQDFNARLADYVQNGHRILSISFNPEGGWAILTDRHMSFNNIHPACVGALKAISDRGEQAICVTFGTGGSWIALSDREFFTGNLPPAIFQRVRDFAANGGVKFAALSLHGGTLVLANGTRYALEGVPIDCERSIEQASVNNQSIDDVTFTKTNGWVVITSRPN